MEKRETISFLELMKVIYEKGLDKFPYEERVKILNDYIEKDLLNKKDIIQS